MAFFHTWKPVLTNPAAQIAQESTTGYKEAHDMGYQLRTRSVLPHPVCRCLTYEKTDTQTCTPMESRSLSGLICMLAWYKPLRVS